MRINTLKLHNFKKFEDEVFQFNSKFTVLIGDNATGKTSILDALATLLGTYLFDPDLESGRTGIRRDEARLLAIKKEGQDFLEPQNDVYVEAQGWLRGMPLTWRRSLGGRGRAAENVIHAGVLDRQHASRGEDIDLPVLLYYGTGRSWLRHREVEIGKPDSRLVAYRHCLYPRCDQNFEEWFKKLELTALQQGKNIPALEAVRRAVTTCIPNARSFYYDIGNGTVKIRFKDSRLLPFYALSNGYRNMVAMVADIAHRACRLNPHRSVRAAEESSGVVLIDELDLHLHPKWQRHVVADLQQAFPNLQFVTTTNSPFILQSVCREGVINLDERTDAKEGMDANNSDIATPAPAQSFQNLSIEDIVENVMGVSVPQRSHRYQQMYDTAKQYYAVLQEALGAEEGKKEELKRKLDELSAPFSDNLAYHAFLEMERLAAGLGYPDEKEKG